MVAAIVGLLIIVYFSYCQTIEAYPRGGGSYTVASANLGHQPGLLAAAALMVDYVLTAAVGITAGVGALVSALPGLQPHTLGICLLILFVLTIVNMRGVRDTGVAFLIPTYLFVGCLLIVILLGIFHVIATGGHPVPVMPVPRLPVATTTLSLIHIYRTTGTIQTVLAGVGTPTYFDHKDFELLPGVAEVIRISSPYKLAGRGFRPEGTVVRFANGVAVGGDEIVVMAGPCSVESREQISTVAQQVKAAGASFLRGGAFKPRSSPYSFQGLGLEGLKLLKEVGDRTGLLIVSEVMEISQIDLMLPYVDVLQVGARNMQNFNLLREIGLVRKPVLLKRGIAATLEELLLSAEYILAGGNYDVMLCERGIRTFETYTRNTMDILSLIHI